ncbi:hypothetical protein [Pseudoduganella lutea]|uniref:Tox-REase-5 domain-containing protein n=1 Tax=Pseudoduganella lutea TaxID=321985 RepID=A0A4P6KX34_9BURK|nr:hypothetical protein [Pseudoduganella lutea]QBE63335.1 hypothetical protein EWM63_10470 [Pseudoduganella lutea]
MPDYHFLQKKVVLIALAFGLGLPAFADEVVVIPGNPPCSGDCSGGPIVGGGFGGGGGPPNGNGSDHGIDGYNDGTKGTSASFNRQPGCQREGYFWAEVAGQAAAGQPPGNVIMDTFGDPLYQAPGWRKFQVTRITREWKAAWNTTMRYSLNIHYMYNIETGQFAQEKLKTSFESGCTGIRSN